MIEESSSICDSYLHKVQLRHQRWEETRIDN
ncbi:hypothetical protein RHRU231_210013 [Rhodococcus ruber]|uniref:Uncharacterized protein n=1 Tax=Rhodococcus ruber TaxID=1830 RepID=A0A098BFX8_9NOCA|nr:hypothetical protein RHRU231_210013 [Rhodococcus ruber]